MSDQNDPSSTPPKRSGRYKPGNTDERGDYIVGRSRTPVSTRFAENDGRRRGRRPKGARNADTILHEELNRTVTIVENGKKRRVSKLHSIILRQLDNSAKGQNPALHLLLTLLLPRLEQAQRQGASGGPAADDLAIIAGFLASHSGQSLGDPGGDPIADAISFNQERTDD